MRQNRYDKFFNYSIYVVVSLVILVLILGYCGFEMVLKVAYFSMIAGFLASVFFAIAGNLRHKRWLKLRQNYVDNMNA